MSDKKVIEPPTTGTTLQFHDPGSEPCFLTIMGNNQENLARVNMDTGEVEVFREPKDEVQREAARVFWETIGGRGQTLASRVEELTNTLQEIKDVLERFTLDGTALGGLRAFSTEVKTEWIERLDETLKSNTDFLEVTKPEG